MPAVFTFGLLWTASAAGACAAQGALVQFDFEQPQMGVAFRVSLYAPSESDANKAARAVFARLRELNLILSDYEPDSELMRLCRTSGPGHPVEVSRELFQVLSQAQELSKATGGAFDVTVGPVVQLWRQARRARTLPDAGLLAEARRRVGWRHVRLNPDDRTVELLMSGMRLDLGGIAKGYAGDEALLVLKRHGITRALVAASGDIVAGDPPPGRDGWRIAIGGLDNPADSGRFLLLKNAAVATSGDAFQHVEIDGTRYSHIVDPATGLGLSTRSSVTVAGPDGITADSLASALSVLGPERGLKLIEQREHVEALFVSRTAAGIETLPSTGFGMPASPQR